MKFLTLVLSACMLIPISHSHAFLDVKPKNHIVGSPYVKITRTTKEGTSFISFELCPIDKAGNCSLIGNKKNYTVDRVEKQRVYEQLEFAGSATAAAGIMIVSVAGVYFIGGLVAGAVTAIDYAAVSAGSEIGFAIGIFSGGKLISVVKEVNPIEQYGQLSVLSDDVINDKEVYVDDFSSFVQNLDFVLKKIK